MRLQNGVQIFDAQEKAPVPANLPTDFKVSSKFGFKVIDIDGKPAWAVANEDDYRKTVGQLLGIKAGDVKINTGVDPCGNIGPTTCNGICWPPSPMCTLIYSPSWHHYVCVCLPA